MMSNKLAVWKKAAGKCWYCGIETEDQNYISTDGKRKRNMKSFSVDHVVPKCLGGTNHIDNCVPCCMQCNIQKRGRTLEEFRTWLSYKYIGGDFSNRQVEWLRSHGIEMPLLPHAKFYFEEAGLTL